MISEARKMGLLTHEDTANLTDVPNIVQKGTRMGNRLIRIQAKEILLIPDRKTNKGKRDYVVLGVGDSSG